MSKSLLFTVGILFLAKALSAQVYITEFFYQSTSHAEGSEFFEITNVGNSAVDLTGWSYADSIRTPGSFDLSSLGILAAGESAIVAELSAEDFRTEWNLDLSVKVIGNSTPSLGRNDEINIYDNNDNLVDRLTFGDQDFPGSERFRYITAVTTPDNYGQNNIYEWFFSALGTDSFGVTTYTSVGGDIGSPGQAPIPEPSTYAAIFGVLVIAGMMVRRQFRK